MCTGVCTTIPLGRYISILFLRLTPTNSRSWIDDKNDRFGNNGLIDPTLSIPPALSGPQTTALLPMADTDKQPSAILSRVPWKLPVANKAEGIYIDLQDGRRLVDAVGMTISPAPRIVIQIFELLQAVHRWLVLGTDILT